MVNRLQENILWSSRSNLMDIPTDCPQRDERMGWTGDIAVFGTTACFNFDMSRFLDKWLRDMRSEQFRGGGIPNTVPRQGYGLPTTMPDMAVDWWDDACAMVPWAEYMARGDQEMLRRNYPMIQKYIKAQLFWAGLFSFGRMHALFATLRTLLRRHGSLGAFLRTSGATTAPEALCALCGAFAGKAAPIVPKDCTSACKRLCLFLRWMARSGSPVDIGLWSGFIDRRTLIMPLDTHVLDEARRLGLISGNQTSMRTAIKLTAEMAKAFPDDPLKGDFALFGHGLETARMRSSTQA